MLIREHHADAAGFEVWSLTGGRRPRWRAAKALAVVVSIAAAGALIGNLAARNDGPHPTPPGPFGYFPS